MSPESGTMIWMLIIFFLAFWILAKFAWKPIVNALNDRKKSIEDSLSAAQKTREEMDSFKAHNDLVMQKAIEERNAMIKEAKGLKDKIINEAHQQATQEAQKVIDEAKSLIEKEKKNAVLEIRGMVTDLSIEIAEKILRKELKDKNSQKELAEKVLNDFKLN